MQPSRNTFSSGPPTSGSSLSGHPSLTPPLLGTFLATGLSLIQHHPPSEARTYFKVSRVFKLFSLPLFFIDCYEVKTIPYSDELDFLQKRPISSKGRLVNVATLVAFLVFFTLLLWHQHTRSESYRNGLTLSKADELMEGKHYSEGFDLYDKAFQALPSHSCVVGVCSSLMLSTRIARQLIALIYGWFCWVAHAALSCCIGHWVLWVALIRSFVYAVLVGYK